MHGVHKDNVRKSSDFVPTCAISLPFWENEKLDPCKKIKINDQDVRLSPLMHFVFERLSHLDKPLAEKVILRGKLIWEYMKWRRNFDDSGIRERHIPAGDWGPFHFAGLENGYLTLWQLLEDDLTAAIGFDGISIKFAIYHFKDFPDFPCIRVILSGWRVKDNGMIFVG